MARVDLDQDRRWRVVVALAMASVRDYNTMQQQQQQQQHQDVVSTLDPRKEKPVHIAIPALGADVARLRVCIVRTAWNETLVSSLCEQTHAALIDAGITASNVALVPDVAGVYELVYAAKRYAETGAFDVVVCFGVIIKGETYHFECLSHAVAQGILPPCT